MPGKICQNPSPGAGAIPEVGLAFPGPGPRPQLRQGHLSLTERYIRPIQEVPGVVRALSPDVEPEMEVGRGSAGIPRISDSPDGIPGPDPGSTPHQDLVQVRVIDGGIAP